MWFVMYSEKGQKGNLSLDNMSVFLCARQNIFLCGLLCVVHHFPTGKTTTRLLPVAPPTMV